MERKLSLDTVGSQDPISEGTVSVAVKDTEMQSLEEKMRHGTRKRVQARQLVNFQPMCSKEP